MMARIANELDFWFQIKNCLNQSDDVTSVLITSSVTSFGSLFKKVFDQIKHYKLFFLLALNLGESFREFR